MKLNIGLLLLTLSFTFLATNKMAFSHGDVGTGGGKSETMSTEFSMISPTELIKKPMSLHDFVKIDEMARIGDVGTGGGFSRWLTKLKIRMTRRLNTPGTIEEIKKLEGKVYYFARSQIAFSEFQTINLAYISEFNFGNYGVVLDNQIYSYYMKPSFEANNAGMIKDFYAVELIDGTILLQSDLESIGLKIYFGND